MNYCECSRPAGDGRYLCKTCAGNLAMALDRAVELLEELNTTAARLDLVDAGVSSESKSVSTSTPDPVNFSAVECADKIRAHIGSWTAADAERIAKTPRGPGFKRKLDALIETAVRIIDLKPERQHLGACPTDGCGEPMNPLRSDSTHYCVKCKETIDVAEYQGSRLGKAWGVVARPPEIVKIMGGMGVKINAQSMKNWVQRDDLAPAGEIAGHPAYRVSDVYDVAMRKQARRRVKAAVT